MSEASGGESPVREVVLDNDFKIVINTDEKDEVRSSGEEAWTGEAETLACEWADLARKKAARHRKGACRNKTLANVFGFPNVVLPVLFAAGTPLIDASAHAAPIQVGAFLFLGFLAGINGFYNFDRKAVEHEHYKARYLDLLNEIRYQLFKSRRFRTPSDEFMARVQVRLFSLDENEP